MDRKKNRFQIMIDSCHIINTLVIALSCFMIFFIVLSAFAFYMGGKAQQKAQQKEQERQAVIRKSRITERKQYAKCMKNLIILK